MLPISIHLDKNKSIPMYLQLANQLQQLIETKQLSPGSSLPWDWLFSVPVRQLKFFRMSPDRGRKESS